METLNMNALRNPVKARKRPRANEGGRFNADTFEALADDLQNKRIPLPRVTVSDNIQTGLRAIIRNTGLISFHVQYDIDGSRPYLKIGDHPEMSVERARRIAGIVRTLADHGIDPQAGLHERLVRELEDKGVKWRP